MQKLYCYVDETGQDPTSEFFIVVAVISEQDQDFFRNELITAEQFAQTNQLKWHKLRHDRRIKYLQYVMDKKIAKGDIYFGRYQKPIPYFFPILETIEKAVFAKAAENYRAAIFIDGIDRKKAAEMTNALRVRTVKLELVRSRRDESEPIIRLADMWAGCIRSALLENKKSQELYNRAKEANYLIETTKSGQ